MLLEILRQHFIKPHERGSYLKIMKWSDLNKFVVLWINAKWYIVEDIFNTIACNIVKEYEYMNSTSIKACFYRNNYQVKSEMMHLGKRKTYLTWNLGTRRYRTFKNECCHLKKLIWKYQLGSKSKAYKRFRKTCLSSS